MGVGPALTDGRRVAAAEPRRAERSRPRARFWRERKDKAPADTKLPYGLACRLRGTDAVIARVIRGKKGFPAFAGKPF